MNVLAHLHLATLSRSSIIGNCGADFIKGDPYRQFPAYIADGIMLHRRIDRLIDQLPQVKQAKALFVPEHQRVAPITLDIVWDHFLSKYWSDYYPDSSLVDFDQQNEAIIRLDIDIFPDEFLNFMQHLWQGQWLLNYRNLDFIAKTLNGMANRRPKLGALRQTISDITANYSTLETLFHDFYPVLIQQAKLQQL